MIGELMDKIQEQEKEIERLRAEIGRLQVMYADEVHKHKVTRDTLQEQGGMSDELFCRSSKL